MWEQAWHEPQKLITQVLLRLKHDDLVSADHLYAGEACRFIGVERWDSRTYLVCDLFHRDYNPDEAHEHGKNNLPVQIVRISERSNGTRIRVHEPQKMAEVDERLRDAHDMRLLPRERVPYRIDFADTAI